MIVAAGDHGETIVLFAVFGENERAVAKLVAASAGLPVVDVVFVNEQLVLGRQVFGASVPIVHPVCIYN